MKEKTTEVKPNKVDETYPISQQPTVGIINLEQLRQMHGGSYGTSGYGIVNAVPDTGQANTLKLTAWLNNSKKDSVDAETLLEEGIDILKENFADYNSLKHLFGKYDATWAIKLGEILVSQKKLVRKAGLEWGEWAAQNLPFIGKRTREKFMNLAKRKDCHQYSFLGVDRLDVLCSATKENDDENDRIGVFMTKYDIQFDPTKEFDPEEFKLQVDTALNRERLIKNDLPDDPVSVRALVVAGKEVTGSMIRKMKEIKECGGDPAEYLKNQTINDGKAGKDEGDDKKVITDFNSLSNKLIKTIDYLIKDNEDEIGFVDSDTFIKLLKKLDILQKLTSIDLKLIQAA
jgi:hypothetical protein